MFKRTGLKLSRMLSFKEIEWWPILDASRFVCPSFHPFFQSVHPSVHLRVDLRYLAIRQVVISIKVSYSFLTITDDVDGFRQRWKLARAVATG